MSSQVDLRQLAVRRDGPGFRDSQVKLGAHRHLVTRYLLPGAVLVGFLAVLGWAARDSLLPARPVTVVAVLTTRAEVQQEGNTPLFQAAGWVEPRPTPVLVSALAEGVVERLLVVEGQEVKSGDPVARLIEADARLALNAAEADLRLREAELASARATLAGARTWAAQPVHLEAELADAEAMLAKAQTEWANLPYQLRAAEARQRLARLELQSRNAAAGVVSSLAVERAQSDLETATATVEELRTRKLSLGREIEALTRKRDALRKRLELKTEETRTLAEAAANEQAAEARLGQAQVAVETARLRLERMTVRALVRGRVLALVARPGMRVMGLAPASMQDSSTVVTLYDPAMLQVRADVLLEDVPRVRPGQTVRIETPAVASGPMEGEVLYATSQADIQKNTLQVKVAVKSPPPVLKPDMLVQATFLALPNPGAKPSGSNPLRLVVPRQLVETGPEGSRVWLVDQVAGVARQRPVKLGAGAGNDLVEVVEGLTSGDRLIAAGREGLREGERIAVTGEDTTLGLAAPQAEPAPSRLPRIVPTNAGPKGHN
jgi:RND family efflux transporter MFP subunit